MKQETPKINYDREVHIPLFNSTNDSSTFYETLGKDVYVDLQEFLQTSVVSDQIELTKAGLENFANYWTKWANTDRKEGAIPIDLLANGEIPITDMIITVPEISIAYRITIFEEYQEAFKHLRESDVDAVIVGMCTINLNEDELDSPLGSIAFPITIISMIDELCFRRRFLFPKLPYKKIKITDIETTNNITSLLASCVFGMGAWYGIQLALLHPATKTIFSHPRVQKRSFKNRPKKTPNRKAKYIRYHIIDTVTPVEDAIRVAYEKTVKLSGEKRSYKRTKLLWRVIGHHKMQNGKRVFVKPHWRGPMKDFASREIVQVNDREVDIVDK